MIDTSNEPIREIDITQLITYKDTINTILRHICSGYMYQIGTITKTSPNLDLI